MSEDSQEVYYSYSVVEGDMYDIYRREGGAYNTHHGQRYSWAETKEGVPIGVCYASIRQINDHAISSHLSASIPRQPPQPMAFWDVLKSFENQSLWQDFRCDGNGSWIHRGLLMGSLVIVHDGSYMPKVAKDVCSAAHSLSTAPQQNRQQRERC